jgi:hypothetical protein
MAATAEHDVTRIEAFSDAVFGFAITLLVVSLAVPDSFDALLQVMKGLPVFAVTFAILLMMWQEHHNLFKRFPCSDGPTIWLNGALLFVVVSYIYPLKFLFSGIVGPAGMRFGQNTTFIRLDQMVTLMLVYAPGSRRSSCCSRRCTGARPGVRRIRWRGTTRACSSATPSSTSGSRRCRCCWRCSAASMQAPTRVWPTG